MRGETAVENNMDEDELRGNLASTETGKRRSVAMLKSMLENSSQGPFFQQYNGGDWSAADVMGSQYFRQNGVQEHLRSSPQNRVSESSTRTNPFYPNYLESGRNGRITEGSGRESDAANAIFFPPTDYGSLDLDSESTTVENGANVSEPQHQIYKQEDDLFQTNIPAHSFTANGDLQDVTIKPPDFISRNSFQTQNVSEPLKENGFDSFKDDQDIFYTTKGNEFLNTQHPKEKSSIFVDPFRAPTNKNDLFQSPPNVPAKPFYKPRAAEAGLFESVPTGQELFSVKETKGDTPSTDDIFGKSLKTNLDAFSDSSSTFDPFSSPIPRDLFDVSGLNDPFGSTPLKQDPFQGFSFDTPDIFKQHGPGTEENDTFPTSLFSGASEVELGMPASTDLLKRSQSKLPPVVPPKPLTKPRVSLQPTPFSQADGVSPSPSLSPTEETNGSHFKRPPRPLPRTRLHRPEIPQQPERPPQPETSLKPERPPQPERPPLFETSLKPQRPPQHERPPQPETYLKPERPPQPETSLKPERPPQPETYLKSERPPQPEISVSPLTQTESEPDASKPLKPTFKRSPKLPKPAFRVKPKTLESKVVSPENYVVFEDVLLIGQEHCVEDWPEDSPELHPDFKPSGKFKLRRNSMMVNRDFDGGSSGDPDASGGHMKKKNRNLRMSLLSRRTSKDKLYDDVKDRSNSLPHLQTSKDVSEANASGGDEDDYLSVTDYKKKPRNTKISNLFRRASSASVGHLPPESKEKKLDDGNAEEDEADYKKRKGKKIKFPQRGFASAEKDEPKGAYGYTPSKGSKEKSLDEDFGAHGYTPHDEFKEYMLDEDGFKKKKSSFSAEELDDEELNGMEPWKPQKKSKQRNQRSVARKPRTGSGLDEFAEGEVSKKDAMSLREMYDVESDELDICKPKKQFKLKVPKKLKSKPMHGKGDDPQGASSANLSEAAQAEWMAAQKDEGLVAGFDEEDEEDGDTDSLMEWWYTVEQWDELPSDEEDAAIKEDESKSFTILADKVERGLRVFNKVFTEQAEVLWKSIIMLHALADDISDFHQKAKIAGITGGTTTAVGGVAAIAGLVLAPFTFGASLAITAVGVGVATAGGITSASAAISDNVNNMQDRKKVEVLLKEYEDRMLDIAKILHFVNQGLYKLRGHPFLRSGTQHYSKDWEIRKAVQVISLVDTPVMRATEITDDAVTSLQGLFIGIDKYFVKESRELKKGYKKKIAEEIRQVANVLNNCLMELNEIREDLHKATGF